MLEEKFIKALKIVSERLEKQKIPYAVTGSSNCAIQGMPVIPKDLDIIVCLKDLERIKEVFKEFFISGIKELAAIAFNGEPGWELKLEIKGIEVQIISERQKGVYASRLLQKKLVLSKIDSFKTKCFSLEAEAKAYEETGRPQKAELIREFLKSKR